MKKLIILSLACLSLLAACSKEGAPQKKGRIDQIFAEKQVLMDGVEQYTLPLRLVEQWNWEGNELYRIDYYEDQATYSENFFYNWRHQIVRTTVPAYDLESELSYDGRLLTCLSIRWEGTEMLRYDLEHDKKGHVSCIRLWAASLASNEAFSLAQRRLGLDLGPDCAHLLASKSAGEVSEYHLSWDHDDLVLIEWADNRCQFSYSQLKNPFHQLYSLYLLDNNLLNLDLTMMSEHCLTLKDEKSDTRTRQTSFNFQMGSHDLPSECRSEYSYQGFDSDFNIVSFTVRERRQYLYL